MKERPILFSGPLVRKILAGEKTVTRRLVNPQFPAVQTTLGFWGCGVARDGAKLHGEAIRSDAFHVHARLADGRDAFIYCPQGKVGDRLWVKEAFALSIRDPEAHERDIKNPADWDGAVHRATYDGSGEWEHYDENGNRTKIPPPWKPSIHMPRWASRLTLEVTEVRCEKLQAITDDDIRAEGVTAKSVEELIGKPIVGTPSLQNLWALGWDAINGERASYASNPFVWVIGFRRIEEKRDAA